MGPGLSRSREGRGHSKGWIRAEREKSQPHGAVVLVPSEFCGGGMIGLTPKQAKLFAFIKAYFAESGGISPSYDEMMGHMGVVSKSGVHRLVTALEERQLIRRIPHRVRSIEVINPDTDTLGFLSPDVLRVVVQTARANDM